MTALPLPLFIAKKLPFLEFSAHARAAALLFLKISLDKLIERNV
jgi:hypothetical protein